MTKDDLNDELTIAYMSGLHRGKELAQRTWVGLTDEEIRACIQSNKYAFEIVRAAEAKLRSKNYD